MDKQKVSLYLGSVALVVAIIALFTPVVKTGLGYSQFTQQTSNGKYTDSADLYQNVQAITERMASNTQYALLQADSAGVMQPVAPSSLAGSFAFTNLRAGSFVRTGDIVNFVGTSTATAANVGTANHWISTPTSTTATITLPSTSTLFAYLTTNGDQKIVTVEAVNTSTIIAVGAGGNLDIGSSATITANKSAELIFTRNSDTTYLVTMLNANN